MNTIPLPGCTPEPLMNYLKALGVFRLVSEQTDTTARGAWINGRFELICNLADDSLLEFFLHNYWPSPVVVPWSDKHFFGVNVDPDIRRYKGTPTGAVLIEAFLMSECPRLTPYHKAIRASVQGMAELGIRAKEDMKGSQKADYIAALRNAPAPGLCEWLDAAAALAGEDLKLNNLFGSGGGSDGRAHFSDNFMQNLWEMLPCFDSLRNAKPQTGMAKNHERSRDLLASALFGEPTDQLEPGRTSSLYNSGAVGGPNAGQGFERKAFTNPWDFILTLEGAIAFAGSVARRLGTHNSTAAFPFQTRAVCTNSDSLESKESSGREIWLPLWHRTCRYSEIKHLLSEGRSDWQGKSAVRGIDFAKAVSSLGVDRGVDSFARYAILKGRVGGDNYCTAAHLGRFEVRTRANVHLLREADLWIELYRRACTDKSPARFNTALRRIDSAVFDFCRFGGTERFQSILVALGQAERELTTAAKFRELAWLKPLRGLSETWVDVADDHSPEFEIAAALAGIRSDSSDPGLRGNLEPVARDKKGGIDWNEGSADVVWTSGSLTANLATTLDRRVLSWKKGSLPAPPLTSSRFVTIPTLSAFLHGELDDDKIEGLLWGLIGCRISPSISTVRHRPELDAPPVPRQYLLLKTAFTGLHPQSVRPRHLAPEQAQLWDKFVRVRPDARLLQLLRSGNLPDAIALAFRRAHNAELVPAKCPWEKQPLLSDPIPTRMAAALLVPIHPKTLIHHWALVARKTKTEELIP